MPLISIVVNVDSRPENNTNEKMFNGVVNRDFLVDNVINKKKLFQGFDAEFIVFLDLHEEVSDETISHMRELADTLIIRKHNKSFEDVDNFAAFNDLNYLQALFCARGKYIFHFDGDVSAFASSPEPIKEYIALLEQYDFVSYPSLWSPLPVHDDSFQGIFWVSTRFFCCKRSTLDFGELMRCQLDYDYWRTKYPRARLCHWLEHILHNGKENCVIYPKVDFARFILFTWERYEKYILKRLNNQTFEEVNNWVCSKPFGYPNNLFI